MQAIKDQQKFKILLYLVIIVFLLYFCICSFFLLTDSFRLLSHDLSGSLLTEANLHNPILGLMMGVFSTAIIQSSSVTTSLVVAMAASGAINLREGIPIIMGTNVGTSLTSTMVSLSNIKNVEEYELGFSVAVVHDLFNWLTILFLLPLELGTGLLEYISGQIVESISFGQNERHSDTAFSLKLLFDPIILSIVELRPINNMVVHEMDEEDSSEESMDDEAMEDDIRKTIVSKEDVEKINDSNSTILKTNCKGGCTYLLSGSSLSDEEKGAILLSCSLLVFLVCYLLIMKTMKSLLSRPLAGAATQFLSKYISSVPCCMGYVFMIIGAIATVLVQSSSILTSSLVPLVSTQVISLESAYPVTLGTNLGTTATSLLAAFSNFNKTAVRLALCHLFFNLFGVLAFYPISFMRWPLFIAKQFGRKVVKYKWLSIFYLILSFFLGPLLIFSLSLVNTYLMYSIVITIITLLIAVILINYLQDKKPELLPYVLKDWTFLPKPLRSFATIDYVVQTYMEVYCCCIVQRTVAAVPVIGGYRTGRGKKKGLVLGVSDEIQMVRIEREEKKE